MAAPTKVRLADGTSYAIPSGERGTFAWARQASLIAVAYKQIGNLTAAAEWDAEYARRAAIWNALESGKDRAAILAQFGKDLLFAPGRILATVGQSAIDLAKDAKERVFKLADLLTHPLFWLGIAVVAVLIFAPVGQKLVRKVTG